MQVRHAERTGKGIGERDLFVFRASVSKGSEGAGESDIREGTHAETEQRRARQASERVEQSDIGESRLSQVKSISEPAAYGPKTRKSERTNAN